MSSSTVTDKAPARRPIREGLFVEAPGAAPRLVGSRCRATGEVFFPAEAMNPVTMVEGTLEPYEFEGAGTLVAWTVIDRGLPGFDAPYAMGTIALDAGPSLIAQLHDWRGKSLTHGMRVTLVIERIKRDRDGGEVFGPKFVPLET